MRILRPVLAVLLLAPVLPAMSSTGPEQTPSRSYADNPTGKGDPAAITCRPPVAQPNSRLLGPEVCRTNAVWAQYRRDGMDVAADGIHDVKSEKARSLNPVTCYPVGGGGVTAGVNFPRFQCSD